MTARERAISFGLGGERSQKCYLEQNDQRAIGVGKLQKSDNGRGLR